MGCASSKEKVCRNCQAPYNSPLRRSYSIDLHHPPHKTGDASCHVVALTSSTLGSLRLDPIVRNRIFEGEDEDSAPLDKNQTDDADSKASIENGENINEAKSIKDEFTMQMIEAKTWSEMIDSKIPKIAPKTPIRTPPGEPETINAWELMEGLEDISPLRPVHHMRSFSFQVPRQTNLLSLDDQPTPRVKENEPPKTVWSDLADSDSNSNSNDSSIASEFDPEVIASFRRALEELPQTNPFHLKPLNDEKEKINNREKDKLIVYFTSLRGVRKTYEDCCHVRVILKGLRVKIDERDVSMHSGFKDELKDLLGEGFSGSFLPKVFLGSKCIGGADEIRRLNEDGKLEKMFESCEPIEDNGGNGNICEACGDIRFVPCETCSGSCKIYYNEEEGYEEDEEEDDDESEHEYGFQRCPDCNENGLIRCPICC